MARGFKSERITVLLAALPGIVACLGIGHFYVGRFRRAVILLLGGWGLAGTAFFCFSAWSMCHMIIPPPGYSPIEPPSSSYAFLAGGIVSFLGLIALWIWQIFNAKAACQNHNRQAGG